MNISHTSIFAVALACSVAAQGAEPCKPGDMSKAPKTLFEFSKALFAADPPCGSARTVMDKLINQTRIGGRKLEEDKPYDPRAAQADLDKALADPEVRKRFDHARSTIPDENTRLAFEAAVLDDEGYYAARELKIRLLLQKLQ